MTIRLVIADDHPLVLNGMEELFRLEEDFELVARCTTSAQTLSAVRRHRPDVIILDIRMPEKDGLAIASELLAEKIPTRVIFYTVEINEDQLLKAIRMGVKGIILKEMEPKLLVQCVRKVHGGDQWIERRTARLSLEKMLRREAGALEIASLLTPRESSILKMVAEGLSNKQIGEKLFISEGTVKVHMHNVYEKVHVSSRVALLRYAQEKGLV
ncbi:MAG TPA: DNA-binding response regulator [Syntrophus sp. (in: bacteria)]|nr:DNA-binding response regulator [Syntrophus sp. (in: bacteria)]